MAKTKKLINLQDDVANLLDGVENQSAYVERAIRDRWQRWQESLAVLAQYGFDEALMQATADALNGVWLLGPSRYPSALALELHDAERLNSVCEKWGVEQARWQGLTAKLGDGDWALGLALLDCVSEFWAGNPTFDAAVKRLSGAREEG